MERVRSSFSAGRNRKLLFDVEHCKLKAGWSSEVIVETSKAIYLFRFHRWEARCKSDPCTFLSVFRDPHFQQQSQPDAQLF